MAALALNAGFFSSAGDLGRFPYTVGKYTSFKLTATGGVLPYAYQAVLPPGLSLDARTGWVSGTIYAEGPYTVYASVTDSLGQNATVAPFSFESVAAGSNMPTPLTDRGIAIMGDSRTAQASYGSFPTAPTVDQASYNLYPWMQNLSFGRFPIWGEYATGGFTSTQIIDTWLLPALAGRPYALSFVGNGNDPNGGLSLAQMKANCDYIIAAVRRAGVKMIILTDPGFENFTAAATEAFHGPGGLNDYLRSKNDPTNGVLVIDIIPILLASTIPIVFNTNMSYDTPHIHWSAVAAVALAQKINTDLAAVGWFPAMVTRDRSNNALLNPDFTTTTGGTLGTGNTGVLPANWTGVNVSSSEWVQNFSTNVRPDGVTEVVSTVTKTAGTSLRDIFFTQTIAVNPGGTLGGQTLNIGDYLAVGCLMDIDAGHTQMQGNFAFADISFTGGTPAFVQAYNSKNTSTSANIPLPPGPYSVELYSRPFKMPDGWTTALSLKPRFGIQMRDNDTITYRVRKVWASKIAPNSLASTY